MKLDRDQPKIDSIVPLWAGANWPECEAYDLLGIKFTGHPNLHRIMLGEDWVGHPLRKDYEPIMSGGVTDVKDGRNAPKCRASTS